MSSEPSASPERPTTDAASLRAMAAAIFLVSASVLTFEIALTRIFSVLLRFHFVFLAISCAICGLGLGGMISVSCGRWLEGRRGRLAQAGLALALGLSLPAALWILLRTPLAQRIFEPLTIPSVAIVPFVLAGAFLSFAFHRHAEASGHLYSADLGGAAAAALGVILILNYAGAINAPLVAGLMAIAACLVLAWGERERVLGAISGVALIGVVILVGINLNGRLLDLPHLAPDTEDLGHIKPLYQELADPQEGAEIVATDWNAFARTDVVSYPYTDELLVYTDGDVPTNMVPFDGDLNNPGVMSWSANIGFAAFITGPCDRALLIGPGAGLDVLFGLMAGVDEMVGVELNPSIPRLMYEFRDFNGSLYAYSNVEMHVAEGRSFVARDDRQYDLIYMALTKTATTATSGLALVEGFIATKEAFGEYLDHLTDQGRIGFVVDHPLIGLRALLTVVQVLVDRGATVEEACGHVALLEIGEKWEEQFGSNPYRCLMLARRTPFSENDRDALAAMAESGGLDAHFIPGRRESYQYLDRLSRRGDTIADYVAPKQYNLLPVTDDQPFFIDLSKGWSEQLQPLLDLCLFAGAATAWLAALLLILGPERPWPWPAWAGGHALLGVACLALPLPLTKRFGLLALVSAIVGGVSLARRDDESRGAGGRLLALVGYFVILGVGFLAIEVTLIPPLIRFLGYPALTLCVIIFGLLLSGSLGSLWAQRWPEDRIASCVRLAALCIVALGVLYFFALDGIVDGLLHLPIILRALVVFVLLAPLGIALGMPFPSGIRLARREFAGFIPSLWGVNGLMSVVGSVGAMLLAREVGFARASLAGSALYLVLVLLVPALKLRSSESPQEADR